MRLLQKFTLLISAICLIAAMIGCGGGGGGTTAGSNQVSVYATDAPGFAFDHVWVTIYKIVLKSAAGDVTLLDNTAGTQLDLTQLRNGSTNVFTFLGIASIPAGTYTGATVTVDKTVTAVPTGSTTSVTKTFKNLDLNGNKTFNVTFASPKVVSTDGSLVFDFNLARWTDSSGGFDGEVDDHNGAGLEDSSKHFRREFKGIVSDLTGTAPDQTFTLTTPVGIPFTVVTSSTTGLTFSNGAVNPALANAQQVIVHGTFDKTTKQFKADDIRIKNNDDGIANPAKAEGAYVSANSAGRSFVMNLQEAEGFAPAGTTVNVVLNDSSVLSARSGIILTEEDFFAQIAASEEIRVEGSYNAGTNTLTAKRAKLKGASSEDLLCEASGAPSAVSLTAKTFTLNVGEFRGGFLRPGVALTVAVDGNTRLVDINGNVVTDIDAFLTSVGSATRVSVEGACDPTTRTINAKRVRIQSSTTVGGRLIEFTGRFVSKTDSQFYVTVVKWEDAPFLGGQQINVLYNGSTQFKDNTGTISAASFFSAFSGSSSTAPNAIKVEGRLQTDGSVTGLECTSLRLR